MENTNEPSNVVGTDHPVHNVIRVEMDGSMTLLPVEFIAAPRAPDQFVFPPSIFTGAEDTDFLNLTTVNFPDNDATIEYCIYTHPSFRFDDDTESPYHDVNRPAHPWSWMIPHCPCCSRPHYTDVFYVVKSFRNNRVDTGSDDDDDDDDVLDGWDTGGWYPDVPRYLNCDMEDVRYWRGVQAKHQHDELHKTRCVVQ